MNDQRPQFDFSEPPASQDPLPKYPFKVVEMSSAKKVAWLIFSRLYVTQLNRFMCSAPKGFKGELEVNYGMICTKHTVRSVMFELSDEYHMPRRIEAADWKMIHEHRKLVLNMIVRASSLYAGTTESISTEEALLLATALGIDGVGKLIPLKLEEI